MNTICNASKIGYIPMFGYPREESIQIREGGRGPILAPNITIFQAFAKSNLTISLGTDLPAG